MGFIQTADQGSLVAFITQRGREYLVNGQAEDFKPRYFAVGDPDTNYLQASQDTPAGSNVLPAGFVPDLSGDYSGAIHSLAAGVVQRSTLRGGAAVNQLGTNKVLGGPVSTVGFGPNRLGSTRLGVLARPGMLFGFELPVVVTSPSVVGGEQVRLYVVPPSRGTSAAFYPALSFDNGGIVTWKAGDPAQKTALMLLNQSVLPPITPQVTAAGGYRFYAFVMAVPYKSNVQIPAARGVYVAEFFLSLSNGSSAVGGSTLPTSSPLPTGGTLPAAS